MRAFALAWLVSAAAYGQPVIGPELRTAVFNSYGPAVSTPSSALGVTRDGSGFAICWSALDDSWKSRVFFARLDGQAMMTSRSELPTGEPTGEADAYHPAIASDGNGFLVAWIERGRLWGVWQTFVARLDRLGQVVRPPRAISTPLFLTEPRPPLVVWNGTSYYVDACPQLVRLSADGEVLQVIDGGCADGAVPTATSVALARHSSGRVDYSGSFFCHTICIQDSYSVGLSERGGCSAGQTFNYLDSLGVGIASNGKQFLLVWPMAAWSRVLVATRIGNDCTLVDPWSGPLFIDFLAPGGGAGTSNPQIVWDGSRFLVVYQVSQSGGTEIRGATVTDGEVGAPFVIASGSVRRPAVIAAGPGHFLVAYELLSVQGAQLAGRLVDFPPPRRRAVN